MGVSYPYYNMFRTFDSIYNDITLKMSPKSKEVLFDTLLKMKTDAEKVEFVDHLISPYNLTTYGRSVKSEALARDFLDNGNRHFGRKLYVRAVELYTQSIAVSPPTATCSALAIAFAYRSAALKPLGYLEDCLLDIDRALDLKYPLNLQYKLKHRQGQCLKELKQPKKAIDSLSKAIDLMEFGELPQKKRRDLKNSMQNDIKMCKYEMNLPKGETSPKTSLGELPSISYGQNDEVPCASDCIAIRYSESMGRHMIATRDIFPGDVLLVEKPYSSILLEECFTTHCGHCKRRCYALMPCSSCSWMMFCSEICRAASKNYHDYECELMPVILRLELEDFHGPLLLRTIAVTGISNLQTYLNTISADDAKTPARIRNKRTRGFNSEMQYISSDFNTIYNLCTNSDLRPKSRVLQTSLIAACFVKILKLQSIPDGAMLSGLVLRLLHILESCTQCHSEYWKPTNEPLNTRQIGESVYATISLMNHSCDGHVVHCDNPVSCVLVAYKPVGKGCQVFDCYTFGFNVVCKKERMSALKVDHFMQCSCEACTNNWPVFSKFPMAVKSFTSRGDSKNLNQVMKHLALAKPMIRANVPCNVTRENLHIFIDLMMSLDRSGKRVTKEYVTCQLAIQEFYTKMGNIIYTTS